MIKIMMFVVGDEVLEKSHKIKTRPTYCFTNNNNIFGNSLRLKKINTVMPKRTEDSIFLQDLVQNLCPFEITTRQLALAWGNLSE